MIPMGQMVSRFLELRAGISAYSINVAASIVGIWIFTGLSFLALPPVWWFAAFGVGMLLLTWRMARFRAVIVAALAAMAALLWWGERLSLYDPREFYGAANVARRAKVSFERTYWSPYQKLTLVALNDGREDFRFVLQTNGSWYQDILNLNPEWLSSRPGYLDAADAGDLDYHRYNLPYRFKPEPENVLILGAGMGNDVAAALRNNSRRVVAVEIDPLIQQLGYLHHLEKPYRDPRVVRVVNDARAYVQNTSERFDLIVSSILDSHITQSSFTNIRTDNYVYTREGLAAMLRILKPGGVLSVSFSDERRWFGGRVQSVLSEISPRPPLVLRHGYFFFLVGDSISERLEQSAELRAFVDKVKDPPVEPANETTDDWPYFYHRSRGIPMIVALLSVLVVALCWGVLRANELRASSLQWHFFFLGAGFMLMEVQIISKLALVFGTTWLVNSIAISALLLLILLANALAARFPALTGWFAYAGLFFTIAACYFTPVQALLFPSFWMRAIVSTLVLCSPVFFAGLIFISSFARAKFQAEAFGSNLFGSVVGGLLEALSFQTGIRMLLVVAALFYIGSLITRRSAARPAVEPAAAPAD
jgi:SAM-dependent methyltransferase